MYVLVAIHTSTSASHGVGGHCCDKDRRMRNKDTPNNDAITLLKNLLTN